MAKEKLKIFLDANILFSASLPNSLVFEYLKSLSEKVDFTTSYYAVDEASRNIRIKFKDRLEFFQDLSLLIESTQASLFEVDVEINKKDLPIICGAISAQADYLLTGDKKDFGHLFGKTIQGVKIVNIQMLLDEL